MHYALGEPVPKLRLDDGTTIWGCECWWSTEAIVKAIIGDRRRVPVDIEKIRNPG